MAPATRGPGDGDGRADGTGAPSGTTVPADDRSSVGADGSFAGEVGAAEGSAPAGAGLPAAAVRAPPRPLRTALSLLLPLLWVVLLLAALGGAAFQGARWLLATEDGTRWLLQRVPGVQIDGWRGAALGPRWQADRVRVEWLGGRRWFEVHGFDARGIRWRWRPHDRAWVALAAGLVSADRVAVETGPRKPRPLPAPPTLALPVELTVARAQLGTLHFETGFMLSDLAGEDLAFDPRAGAAHRVGRATGRWNALHLTAGGTIEHAAPFALALQGSVRDDRDAPRWAAALRAAGPLETFELRATLRGLPRALPGAVAGSAAAARDPVLPAVDARVTLQPLLAWVLGAVDLRTEALDLAVLWPAAPQTRLSGSVVLTTRARDAPMSAQLAIVNALPGRWDEHRLPLLRASATVSGRLDDRRRVDIDAFEVVAGDGRSAAPGAVNGLSITAGAAGASAQSPPTAASGASTMAKAPPTGAQGTTTAAKGAPTPSSSTTPAADAPTAAEAGRWSGSGGWNGTRLTLATQLRGLQPHRLDTRAAAMRLSGPVALTVDGLPAPDAVATAAAPRGGLRVAWRGELDGRLEGLPQAVRLATEGNAAAGRLEITRALASAGAASFDARALVQRSGPGAPWHVTTQGRLQDFDPLPWWPGESASVWRRGPHRVSGQWRLDVQLPADAAALPLAALGQRVAGDGTLQLRDSVLAGVPWSADLRLGQAGGGGGATTTSLHAEIDAGGNRIVVDGRGDPAGSGASDRLQFDLKGERLAALAPWAQLHPALAAWLPRRGSAEAEAVVEGRWPALRTQGRLRAAQLQAGPLTLAAGRVDWQFASAAAQQPLLLKLDLAGLRWAESTAAPWQADHLRGELVGTLAEHRLTLSAAMPGGPPLLLVSLLDAQTGSGTQLEVQAQGSWQAAAASPSGSPGFWSGAGRGATEEGSRGAGGAVGASGAGAAGGSGAVTPAAGGLATASGTIAGGRWRGRVDRAVVGPWDGSAAPGSPSSAWLDARDLRADLRFGADGTLAAAQLEPGRVDAAGGVRIRWDTASWARATARGTPQLRLRADIDPVAVAPLLARWQPRFGWRGDLALKASVDITAGARFDAEIVAERARGDLHVDAGDGALPLGLDDLQLRLSAHDGQWQFTPVLQGRRLGAIAGSARVRTDAARRWPGADAPMEGVLQLRVPDIGIWSAWIPPGWRLAGRIDSSATLAGTFGDPRITGEFTGAGLAVRNLLQGVNVADGQVAVRLEGDRATIERFTLHGGDGTLVVSGGASVGARPEARLQIRAERFRALGRVDRLVVVSGDAALTLQAEQARLEGRVTVDEGLIDATTREAPALDEDVVVRRPGQSDPDFAADAVAPRPQRPFALALDVDLGPSLRVKGRGLDTALRGQLRLTTPANRLAVAGRIATAGGTYAAYGQRLEIERGVLAFNGPVNDPRLDVVALRPNTDLRVGVAIGGTLLAPRVRLFSEPEMSETDKLSWLVLGRAADGLGRSDTALLQRAAVALLAGEGEAPTDKLLKNLGLDELSLRQSDGEVRETIVTLGKQLSRRWYVGYERGVNATAGTWQLIYRVAQRFTLRAQSGLDNSVDLIWVWRRQEAPADAAMRRSVVVRP